MIVMTYNIRSGRNMAGDLNIAHAAQTISDLAPDIVGLNEVRSHSADVGPVNQAEQLGELLPIKRGLGVSSVIPGGSYFSVVRVLPAAKTMERAVFSAVTA